MKPRHQVSRAALELIKGFEGFRARAARLPDGRWTIGYGHTKTARQGAEVSQADAEYLLIYDLMEAEAAVRDLVFTPLSDNQFDALGAFVFNIGVENFKGSAVLRRLNAGETLKAAYAMELWRKAEFEGETIVVDALVRRRAAEKTLFLTPEGGFVPSPTALVQPRLDEDGADQAPATDAVEVIPFLTGDHAVLRRPEPLLIPAPVEDLEPDAAAEPELPLRAAKEPLIGAEASITEAPAADAAPQARAEAAAAEPVAYDGEPLLAPSVEDEAPLAPGAVTEAEAVLDPAAATAIADPAANEAPMFGAAAFPSEPRPRGVTAWASILGVIGLILTIIGVVSVYRGRYFHSGATGYGLVLGIAGIFCVAGAVYFLLDRIGAREAD